MANVAGMLKHGFKVVKNGAIKYAPDILGAIGVGSLVAGVILAIKDTPKAIELREKAEEKKGSELTKSEKVAVSLPAYIPTITATVTGVACVAGGYGLLHKRLSVTAMSLAASDKALERFTGKAREIIGDKKTEEIKDAATAQSVLENPLSKNQVIITGKGEHLCYDEYSGVYFKSDIESIRKAVNDFNSELLEEMYKPLSDLYDKFGDIKTNALHESVGWCIDDGLVDARFSSHLTDTGEPCLAISYWNDPKPDFSRGRF